MVSKIVQNCVTLFMDDPLRPTAILHFTDCVQRLRPLMNFECTWNDLFSLIPFWLVLKFVSTESRFELEPKTRYSKKKFPLLQIYSLVFNSHNLWQTSFLSLLFSIIQLYNTVKVYAVMSKKTIKSNLETINFWSL